MTIKFIKLNNTDIKQSLWPVLKGLQGGQLHFLYVIYVGPGTV